MRRCISSFPSNQPVVTKTVPRAAEHTWPQLPPELTDSIIDFLANDAASLKACGLAGRIFLPSSRKHLFRRVVLRPSTSKATPSGKLVGFLLSAPHLLPYVTSLRLVEGDFQLDGKGRHVGWMARDHRLATLLARLPTIRGLSLESTFRPLEWNNLPKGLKVSIRGILKSIQLTDLALMSVAHFPARLLLAAHNLKRLEAKGIILESISLDDSGTMLFDIEPCLAAVDSSCLRRISITTRGGASRYSRDISLMSQLLERSRHSLCELELLPSLTFVRMRDVVHHPLVLGAMPNLKSLKLGVEISDFDTASTNPSFLWVSTVLNNIPPANALEEITLKCEIIFGNGLRQLDRAIWKMLDWCLTREALGNLRRVKLLVHTVHNSEDLAHKFGSISSFLEHQLVSLRRRGVLCIEEVYDLSTHTSKGHSISA
ncbi:unnamed protein product [Cyclocybe aegerita]|uniref:Uncharacterized protein n=1 Tax=Cyclocybe aegerita TaxID=1973307 RepID=A0A8S0W904_CYCAE|nr:unnamed protein product [Cyclocybe aegerita]